MIALLLIPLAIYLLLLFLASTGAFGLSLDRTVKLSDLTGITATTLVAVILQYFIQRRGKATDSEKTLLTTQIQSILASLIALRDLLSSNVTKVLSEEETIRINQKFDSVSEELSTLQFCLTKSHCKKLVSDYKWIEREFLSYKAAVTGGTYPTAPISFAVLASGSSHRNVMDKDLRLLVIKIAKQ